MRYGTAVWLGMGVCAPQTKVGVPVRQLRVGSRQSWPLHQPWRQHRPLGAWFLFSAQTKWSLPAMPGRRMRHPLGERRARPAVQRRWLLQTSEEGAEHRSHGVAAMART